MPDFNPPEKKMCHRTGFTRQCRELVTNDICQDRWQMIRGVNPNTGEEVNKFGCADDLDTWLKIEHSKLLNEVGAAVESFRNMTTRISMVATQCYLAGASNVPEQQRTALQALVEQVSKEMEALPRRALPSGNGVAALPGRQE